MLFALHYSMALNFTAKGAPLVPDMAIQSCTATVLQLLC